MSILAKIRDKKLQGGVIYDPPPGTNRVAKYFGTDRVKRKKE